MCWRFSFSLVQVSTFLSSPVPHPFDVWFASGLDRFFAHFTQSLQCNTRFIEEMQAWSMKEWKKKKWRMAGAYSRKQITAIAGSNFDRQESRESGRNCKIVLKKSRCSKVIGWRIQYSLSLSLFAWSALDKKHYRLWEGLVLFPLSFPQLILLCLLLWSTKSLSLIACESLHLLPAFAGDFSPSWPLGVTVVSTYALIFTSCRLNVFTCFVTLLINNATQERKREREREREKEKGGISSKSRFTSGLSVQQKKMPRGLSFNGSLHCILHQVNCVHSKWLVIICVLTNLTG